jgi:hypothetical protein
MPTGFQSWLKGIITGILIFLSTVAVKAQDEKLLPEMDYSTGLQSNAVRCIKVAKSGNVYLGTDNGLNILGALTVFQNAIIQQIGNKSVWGLELMDSLLFVGTRSEGLQVYSIKTGRLLYNYSASVISLIRKIKVFDDRVFILTNNSAFRWQNGKLSTIRYIRPANGSFIIDIFEFQNKIYGINYPEKKILGFGNNEFADSLNKEFVGNEFDSHFQAFCAEVYGDKVFFPSSYGSRHLITIWEQNKPPREIQILKDLPAGYIIWDMKVLGSKLILAVGDTYSNEKGFIYIKDIQQEFDVIEPSDYVNCIGVDSINNVLYYGTLNNGLFCQPAISDCLTIQMSQNLKLSAGDSNITLTGYGEALALKSGKFVALLNHGLRFSDAYLSTSYLKDKIIVSGKKDIRIFDSKTLNEINLPWKHPLITNELATSESLSLKESGNVTVNYVYRFDSYGQVRKYNLNTGAEVILKDIESFIPVTLKQDGKIFLQNKEKGFCLIDGISAYRLTSKNVNVPFARDFAVIRDTLYLLIRNYLEELKVDYTHHALIPIRSFNTINLCEGFSPQWILSKNDKLYLLNSNGILQVDPQNGSPLNYFYLGNNFKIQKPVIGGSNLIWATQTMLSVVPFDEIDKPISANNITVLSLKFPENQNENIDFKVESNIQQYITQSHSLKSLEVWHGDKMAEKKYTINNTFSFKNGLKYGDYGLVLRAGNFHFKKLLSISLPLNRNPYFFGSIFILMSVILLLGLINVINKRVLNRKLAQVRLQSLKQNLNPHFVYNSMNLISSLILEEKYDDAVQIVADFSNLQRTYLETNNKDMISLEEELEFLNAYLKLQQKRFENDNLFEYTIDVTNEIEGHRIMLPPLILQPLAENAVKYGVVGSKANTKMIHVEVKYSNDYFIVGVEDNGIDVEANYHGLGIGHKLVSERITLYNSTYGTNIRLVAGIPPSRSTSGYRVELEIPV